MLCFMIKICHIVENKNYVKKEKKKSTTQQDLNTGYKNFKSTMLLLLHNVLI